MFGVEPQEQWSKEEFAEFEVYAAVRLKNMLRSGLWATYALLANILCVVPFLDGFPFHREWDIVGRYLVLAAMALLLLFVYRWGLVWAAWQSARETRTAFGEPL
jgi:hypothetical protein